MDSQLVVICGLTLVIHLVGTLAYSVRIAGVRTRRVAVSFALFNILVLVSRMSNSLQAPFLAKRVERNLGASSAHRTLLVQKTAQGKATANALFYQWQAAAPGSRTFTNIPGANGTNYTPTLALTDSGTKYQIQVATLGTEMAGAVQQGSLHLLGDFRWLLFSATLGTVIGALLIPTSQRVFSRAVLHFQAHRSILQLLRLGFFGSGLSQIKASVSLPHPGNVTRLRLVQSVSVGTILLNVAAVALWTVGAFASLYAGYGSPDLRLTCNTLSPIVNGGATILMFVFIDPNLSVMTDDVVEGRMTEPRFRQAIVWLVGSRFAGTVLAQALLVPAAALIVCVARIL